MIFIVLLFVAAFSANLSFFLDFAFGNPSGQPHTGAVFFKWTLFLAKQRLMKQDTEYLRQTENITDLRLKENANAQLVVYARQYFTWENMIGMCSVCTNFWIATYAFLVSLILYPYPIEGNLLFVAWLSVVLLSHTILRKFFYNQ
jgi:hypothetical protein